MKLGTSDQKINRYKLRENRIISYLRSIPPDTFVSRTKKKSFVNNLISSKKYNETSV